MNIAIGNDHAGTEYKQEIKKMLLSENHNVNNHGTDNNQSVDYPDHIHPCLLYTSPSPRDGLLSRMPSSA